MRTKVTLILILLNVALLAVIIYSRREWKHQQDLARISKRVLGDEAIGMKSLEITASGSTGKIRLERADENASWNLKSPIDWPANEHAIRRIVHELEFLEPINSFDVDGLAKNGQSLADYGLKPPKLTLDFTRPSRTPGGPDIATRLEIGDTTKVGGERLYVLSPDGKTVHVVNRSLAQSLIVGMDELRTDTLFTIPVFEVRSLGLQNAAPAPRVRLRRDGARWSFEAPIVTRASKSDAEVVISGLNRLRALDFINDVPTADTGLDKPSLRVTLEGNSRRETLLLGLPYPESPAFKKETLVPTTAYYARMEERSQVFVTSIPDGLLTTLRRAQEKLRDTRVLDFEPTSVSAISLIAAGQTEPLVLRRDDAAADVWRIVRPGGAPALPADAKFVGNLLQRLSLLTATPHNSKDSAFLRDAPSDAEVENYGFNLPQREITLTLAAGKTITLQIGVSGANGGTVQARVRGQPFIYAVPADTLNELPVAANVYRERTLRALPEGTRITSLTLTANDAADKPLVSLKPADNQSWDEALATETEPRREALKTVLASMATLRAKEFVNDVFTETTLVDGRPTPWKYTLAVTFTSGTGATQTGTTTLQVAERSGGGAQLAGSKEFNTVFVIEQSMLDALWTLTYGARDPGPPAAVVPATRAAAP
ncbi:DUF4340 domain-containing protein [Rariglobus hedericola]|uniref:DUF4340 domain-containing protein n=1 Tax=Rariglobus hedericola TaxID=2597822 RepID=A0A556QR30_9BACT|nr:DUF4340 domain-containing protein [Rariglobus hedericola]TSJ79098.1 DUF4340 domain-containing protein [Rariglobus hedericola]